MSDALALYSAKATALIGTSVNRVGARRQLQFSPSKAADRPASRALATGPGRTVAALLALNAALVGRNRALLAELDRYVRAAGTADGNLGSAKGIAVAVAGKSVLRMVLSTVPDDAAQSRVVPSAPFVSGLTPRQAQFLHMVRSGQPNKNIAADLLISQRTVENHRAAIMRRTGATSLPALARMAVGAAGNADCKALRTVTEARQ